MKAINKRLHAVAWAIAIGGVNGANAQTVSTQSLGAVIITGQMDAMTHGAIESARDMVKSIPGGAAVVDLAQVREGRQSTWTDSLGMAPGVFIQDRFGSEEARIAIRGSALSRTYHSFGIKVMQDGVPVHYADGFFDMQTVDPNASRYVEVLRGPNATTYGATTLGGAVNFVAPTGYSQSGSTGRAELGSFGFNKLFSSTAGVQQADVSRGHTWDHYLAVSQTQQDGFRDHAQMENQKLLGNWGVKLNRDVESRFYVAAVRSRAQLPGYLNKAEMNLDPAMANSSRVGSIYPYREEDNRRRDVDAQRIANKTTVRDGDSLYEFAVYAMNYSLWHPIDSIIEQNAKTQGAHLKVTRFLDRHQLSLGYLPNAGTTHGSAKPTNHQGVAIAEATSVYNQTSRNDSLFVEDKYRLSDRTTVTLALQYDRARRKVADAVAVANNYDHVFSQWSPRAGVTHELSPVHQVFASVSRNFEAPIFGLAGTTTQASKAQSGTTVEVGTRGEVHSGQHEWAWDLTYYRAQLNNEFLSACIVAGCTTPTTTNVPKSLHQGIELGGRHLYNHRVESRMALLYSDFRFVNSAFYGGNALPGFPPLIVRAESLYRFGGEIHGKPASYAGPKLEWVPRKAPMDNANTLFNDAYAVIGFKAGHAIDRQWSWFADARNLTNRKYAATTNIAASYASAPAGAYYYPGDGRSLYVGVDAKWH